MNPQNNVNFQPASVTIRPNAASQIVNNIRNNMQALRNESIISAANAASTQDYNNGYNQQVVNTNMVPPVTPVQQTEVYQAPVEVQAAPVQQTEVYQAPVEVQAAPVQQTEVYQAPVEVQAASVQTAVEGTPTTATQESAYSNLSAEDKTEKLLEAFTDKKKNLSYEEKFDLLLPDKNGKLPPLTPENIRLILSKLDVKEDDFVREPSAFDNEVLSRPALNLSMYRSKTFMKKSSTAEEDEPKSLGSAFSIDDAFANVDEEEKKEEVVSDGTPVLQLSPIFGDGFDNTNFSMPVNDTPVDTSVFNF